MRFALGLGLLLVVGGLASAQKKPAKAEGVKLLKRVVAEKGFLDDVFAFDGAGGRLALVRSDAASFAEVEVLDLDQGGRNLAKFDLSAVTTNPLRMSFVLDGFKLLVVAKDASGEKVNASLVAFDGKVVRKWGPVLDVALTTIDGAEAIVVFDKKPGKKGESTYEIAAHRLETGKPVKKKQKIVADVNGFVKKLDLQILYWSDAYTMLVGRKRGQYDKFKDQRMNDSEAVYSLLEGTFVKNQPMKDLIVWTKLVKLRSERQNEKTVLHLTEDLKGLEVVTADDRRVPVELAETFFKYDSKSLLAEMGRDGRIYFTMTIDPVNPAALDRKVADPEIIDLYVVEATGGKAKRLARLPRNERRFVWHAARDRWAVLRKHKGIDRGGTELEIYDLTGL
jgi:hypothetical protein